MRAHRSLRRGTLFAACTFGLVVSPMARATWSIVMVDRETREVALGTATCLTSTDLRKTLAVMLVGVGASANQSAIDSTAANRRLIWEELQKGTKPGDIIDLVKATDPNWSSRQIGIVDMEGRRAALTGNGAGRWRGHVTGRSDTLIYAIQGNVLAGEPVILAAEEAILNTPGDLAEKLMAGMEAAALMGGDGRCSCRGNRPTECGSPPEEFDKSAHVGTILVARLGDLDGVCNVDDGCANGRYYLAENVKAGSFATRDPVRTLRIRFNEWREELRGVPDQLLSTKEKTVAPVPGNGTRQTAIEVVLKDWAGNQLPQGGATLEVRHNEESAGLAFIDEPIDHGDGTYTIPLVAGVGAGADVFDIVVVHEEREVLLYPPVRLRHDPTLAADQAEISGIDGATIQFDYQGPEAVPGREYLLLASLAGTTPGITTPLLHIPLNFDDMFLASFLNRNSANFVNTWGFLNTDGTGSSQFVANPGSMTPFLGIEIDCAMITLNPMDFATNPWKLTIVP